MLEARTPPLTPPPSPARRPRLVVHRDARWLVPPDGEPIPCLPYRLLRRLLTALVAARVERPGEPLATAALYAIGWPGERILPDAARNRMHVAVYRLRRLGLERWLEHYDGGWRLSPELDVEVSLLREPATPARRR